VSNFLGAMGDVFRSASLYASTMRFAALLAIAAVGEWIAGRAQRTRLDVDRAVW